MECPVGTVMSRLHRGRRLLKQALRDFAIAQGIVKRDETADDAEMIRLDDYRAKPSKT